MEYEFWILGGDARNRCLAEWFRAEGHQVHTYGVAGLPEEALPERFSRLVLPFPSFDGRNLRGPGQIPLDMVTARLTETSLVFGGMLSQAGLPGRLLDLYGTEPLTTANAVPTAEGAIALAMEQSPRCLAGSQCLVIGYGRIGKVLAHRLLCLGAKVTVAARKPGDRALAEALGCMADVTGAYTGGLAKYDFIFNTVPAPVITDSQLSQVARHCLLLELASDAGYSPARCQALGLTHIPGGGLPGRYSPMTAAALYGRSILSLCKREEKL